MSKANQERIPIPLNRQIVKQSEAYALLFVLENKLRVAMHNIMIEYEGLNYFNEINFPRFTSKMNVTRVINIAQKASRLKSNEEDYNLRLQYSYHLFWYIDFSEIVETLTFFFDKYFCLLFLDSKEAKDFLIPDLFKLVPIRNGIAHNRYISHIDLSEIKRIDNSINNNIFDKYLANVNDLAFNSFEALIDRLANIFSDFEIAIKKRKYIKKEVLLDLKSIFGIFASAIDNFDSSPILNNLLQLIAEYNNFPRTPGSSKKIDSFAANNKLLMQINTLRESLWIKNL